MERDIVMIDKRKRKSNVNIVRMEKGGSKMRKGKRRLKRLWRRNRKREREDERKEGFRLL